MFGQFIGSTLLGYTILREIGEGGMGKVYLAENATIGQQVAIKVLDPVLARNSELRERFNQEARIQVALQHNNIVRIFNAQSSDELSFLVMEYIDGESLDKVLRRRGKLSADEAIKIMRQVLDAVGYAHSKGIVHRDLKPSNILVCADGTAKVTDFGIAKVLGDTKLTRTGTSMGSPDYMSPEQVLGKKDIDHRTDIYSLGATLYEMLTGRPPFVIENGGTSDSDFLLKQAHVRNNPIDPRSFNGLITDAVSECILKSLIKHPEGRFSSCSLFADFLRNTAESETKLPDTDAFQRQRFTPPLSENDKVAGDIFVEDDGFDDTGEVDDAYAFILNFSSRHEHGEQNTRESSEDLNWLRVMGFASQSNNSYHCFLRSRFSCVWFHEKLLGHFQQQKRHLEDWSQLEDWEHKKSLDSFRAILVYSKFLQKKFAKKRLMSARSEASGDFTPHITMGACLRTEVGKWFESKHEAEFNLRFFIAPQSLVGPVIREMTDAIFEFGEMLEIDMKHFRREAKVAIQRVILEKNKVLFSKEHALTMFWIDSSYRDEFRYLCDHYLLKTLEQSFVNLGFTRPLADIDYRYISQMEDDITNDDENEESILDFSPKQLEREFFIKRYIFLYSQLLLLSEFVEGEIEFRRIGRYVVNLSIYLWLFTIFGFFIATLSHKKNELTVDAHILFAIPAAVWFIGRLIKQFQYVTFKSE